MQFARTVGTDARDLCPRSSSDTNEKRRFCTAAFLRILGHGTGPAQTKSYAGTEKPRYTSLVFVGRQRIAARQGQAEPGRSSHAQWEMMPGICAREEVLIESEKRQDFLPLFCCACCACRCHLLQYRQALPYGWRFSPF